MHRYNSCTSEGYERFHNHSRHKSSRYQEKHCGDRKSGFCFSLLLIGTGVLFLLSHMGMLGSYSVIQFWPLLILFPALSRIIRSRSWFGRVNAMLLSIFSGLALVNSLQLIVIPWSVIWPVAVVAFGAIIMAWVAISPRRAVRFEIPENVSGNKELLQSRIVCGGSEEDFGSGEFRGGVIDVFMGGYDLDLRGARMASDSVELYIKVKLGGVKIRVPQNWHVQIEGETFMAEIEDNTSNKDVETTNELKVIALVKQGALEIQN